ncbi:hypothetical protein C8R30_13019 [Nitrosomonas nitrosa]|nr:hypothetical protein C8R30_13019 [Nitrosomonas nitrosa]
MNVILSIILLLFVQTAYGYRHSYDSDETHGLYEVFMGFGILVIIMFCIGLIWFILRIAPELFQIIVGLFINLGLVTIILFFAYQFYIDDSWIISFLFILWAGYAIKKLTEIF